MGRRPRCSSVYVSIQICALLAPCRRPILNATPSPLFARRCTSVKKPMATIEPPTTRTRSQKTHRGGLSGQERHRDKERHRVACGGIRPEDGVTTIRVYTALGYQAPVHYETEFGRVIDSGVDFGQSIDAASEDRALRERTSSAEVALQTAGMTASGRHTKPSRPCRSKPKAKNPK